MRKTYKREMACMMLAWICALGCGAIALDSEMAFRVLEIAIAPVFLFAAGAFGMDSWAKQINEKNGKDES